MKRVCYGLLRVSFLRDGFGIAYGSGDPISRKAVSLVTAVSMVWRNDGDGGCRAEGFGELWMDESGNAVVRPLGSR